ncbi:MAG: hypothetical protein J3K34DRAFT_117710 [Monoraphidium minutum]|nr:MAG: hypothetical protein J3K34DRAFT_117710 [Monoraphidium minutum]
MRAPSGCAPVKGRGRAAERQSSTGTRIERNPLFQRPGSPSAAQPQPGRLAFSPPCAGASGSHNQALRPRRPPSDKYCLQRRAAFRRVPDTRRCAASARAAGPRGERQPTNRPDPDGTACKARRSRTVRPPAAPLATAYADLCPHVSPAAAPPLH